jgi:uncharacterized protein YfaP (DUF2135 family)
MSCTLSVAISWAAYAKSQNLTRRAGLEGERREGTLDRRRHRVAYDKTSVIEQEKQNMESDELDIGTRAARCDDN